MYEYYTGEIPSGFMVVRVRGDLGKQGVINGEFLMPRGTTPRQAFSTMRMHARRPSELLPAEQWVTALPLNAPLTHNQVLTFRAVNAQIAELPRQTNYEVGVSEPQHIPGVAGFTPAVRPQTSLLEKVSGGLGWLIALPIVAAMYVTKGAGVGVARAGLAIGRKAVKPVSVLSVLAAVGGAGWVWWNGQTHLNEDYAKSGVFNEEFACEVCYTPGRAKTDIGHAVLCPTCGVRTMTRNISVRKDFEARPYFWAPQTQSVRTEVRDPDTGEVLRVTPQD